MELLKDIMNFAFAAVFVVLWVTFAIVISALPFVAAFFIIRWLIA